MLSGFRPRFNWMDFTRCLSENTNGDERRRRVSGRSRTSTRAIPAHHQELPLGPSPIRRVPRRVARHQTARQGRRPRDPGVSRRAPSKRNRPCLDRAQACFSAHVLPLPHQRGQARQEPGAPSVDTAPRQENSPAPRTKRSRTPSRMPGPDHRPRTPGSGDARAPLRHRSSRRRARRTRPRARRSRQHVGAGARQGWKGTHRTLR